MPYRRTKKAAEARERRIRAMLAGKERARLNRAAPAYPVDLPELRMRITIERLDFGRDVHVVELRRTRRVDVYAVTVDGAPWRCAGLSAVLAGIRKAHPRVLSARAVT